MKKNFIIAGLLIAGLYSAQQNGSVGINTKTPSGATLQVEIAADATPADGQGVAVPNVTKARLNQMTGTIATSAMVYVTDASAADDSKTTKVKEVGYHYFDGTEWVKLGGGSTSSSAASTTLGSIRGNIRPVSGMKAEDWVDGDFAIIIPNGAPANFQFPVAGGNNKGRIVAVRNSQGGTVTFTANGPLNNGSISNNRGMLVMSDGTNWHVIGGF